MLGILVSGSALAEKRLSVSLPDVSANVKAQANTDLDSTVDLNVGSDDDVKKASVEIDASVKEKARVIAFNQVHRGIGWATSDDDGKLLTLFWVEKQFVEDSNETTRAQGVIKLESEEAYKLVLDSKTNTSLVFKVRSNADTTGTLEIIKEKSLTGLTVWTGTLNIDGNTYKLDLATKDGKVRENTNSSLEAEANSSNNDTKLTGQANASVRGEGKKLGLFARFRAAFS